MFAQCRQCAGLVFGHELGIANDVSGKNGGEFALQYHSPKLHVYWPRRATLNVASAWARGKGDQTFGHALTSLSRTRMTPAIFHLPSGWRSKAYSAVQLPPALSVICTRWVGRPAISLVILPNLKLWGR